MTNFLPNDYSVPKVGGNYLKLVQGENKIRILSNPIIGWEDWDDNKPIRFPYSDPKPAPIDPQRPVKHFWAFIVWSYNNNKVMILEITQATIQEVIKHLNEDIEWGSPLNYDIKINKTGEKMETKYSVLAVPPKPLAPEIVEAFAKERIDLNQLFVGGDPFAGEPFTDYGEEIRAEEIPL